MPRTCAALLTLALAATLGEINAQDAPKLRLNGNFRPVEYSATLRVVPEEEQLKGTIEISVQSREPAKVIWLNAAPNLLIEEASLNEKPARPIKGDGNFQGIAFDTP